MMGEDWAAVENIACRDMYFDCVEELCHYLKTEEKFEELYRVAHSAAEIYPFYDWQIWGKSTASSECPATKTASMSTKEQPS